MLGKIKAIVAASVVTAVSFALSGCDTTSSVSQPPPVTITKGMPVTSLVELLGEPDSKEPYKEDLDNVELWVYTREDVNTDMISTDLEEQLYIDPISGAERTVYNNVMSPETRTTETRTLFLIVEGKVQAWKVEKSEQAIVNG